MKRTSDTDLLIRLLIPLILVPILGISPRPHIADRAMQGARRAIEFGNPLGASQNLYQALQRFPFRSDLWELAAGYALQGGDPQSAILYIQKHREVKNLTSEGYTILGDAYFQQNELPAAIRAWKTSLQIGGDAVTLYTKLESAHRLQADYAAALTDLRALLALQPDDPQVNYKTGLLLATSQPEDALEYLQRAAELDPALAASIQELARSLSGARFANDRAYSLLQAGRSLAAMGLWDLAGEAFKQGGRLRPGFAEAWAYLGEARYHLGADGLADLEKALALDPKSVAANTFLGLYWQRQDRNELALVYLNEAAELDPDNPALQAEIGNATANLGNVNEALVYYQKAAELAPRDPTFWRILATFCIKYDYQVGEVGLPAARQAVILDPNDPASLDVMGQIFSILDDTLSAKRFLSRALQSNPGYAPARLHLGLLYLIEGDTTSAHQELTLARLLAKPESLTSQQVQRLLDTYFP